MTPIPEIGGDTRAALVDLHPEPTLNEMSCSRQADRAGSDDGDREGVMFIHRHCFHPSGIMEI